MPAVKDITLADYLRPLWRFKYVTSLVVAAVTFGVYRYYDGKPSAYRAASQVYVGSSALTQVLKGDSTNSSSPRNLANQAELIATPNLANQVAKRLGLDAPAEALLGAIVVAPSTAADFITITATTSSPASAAQLANGFATTYLDERASAKREATRQALDLAQRQYRNTPKSDTVARKAAAESVTQLQSTLSAPPDVGTVTRQASAFATPIGASPRRHAIFGGVLALLLCVIATYAFDRSDRRLRKVEDVESLYDVPVLATVPHIRHPAPVSDRGPEVPGALREPHRTLRVNLGLNSGVRALRSILFTSAVPEEGKSTVVRNLALAYAEAGSRVAVVEADLRRPTLAKTFGLDARCPGLAEVLLGKLQVDAALNDVRRAGSGANAEGVNGSNGSNGTNSNAWSPGCLHVMTAGSAIVEPTSVLTADRMRSLIALLLKTHDVVLLDSPPLLPVSDALPLLSVVDGIVLVARTGVTTSDAAIRLQRTIARAGEVRVLGTVVTAVHDTMAYGYEHERPSGARARDPESGHPVS